MKKKFIDNPWFLFLPFLFLYIIVVCLMHKNILEGDEGRYYEYAQNLLHGFYSPKGTLNLWNGPGYPIILMPLVALHLPMICITILNAIFQYLSVVVLFKTLLFFVSKKKAIVFSLFWACYYIVFKEMARINTESFTILLIVLFQYSVVIFFADQQKNKKYVWITGLIFGFLILTKVMFAYVLYGVIPIALIAGFIFHKAWMKKITVIMLIAFCCTLPYLFYTYHLTGKPLYWANTGGASLYWASTPYEGEFGDWNNETFTTYCGWDSLIPCNASFFAKNHEEDFKNFRKLNVIEQDDAFKKKGIENIKLHPAKYFKNCVANFGRMIFGVPQSFYFQRFQTLMRIPPNAIVFTFLLFSFIATIIFFKRIQFSILFLVMMMMIYLAGTVLICAEQRQFYVIVPIILLWTAYLIQHIVQVKISFNKK